MSFKCPFCNRILSTLSGYRQHVKICMKHIDVNTDDDNANIKMLVCGLFYNIVF
jgi:transcription elongation factor Elf1